MTRNHRLQAILRDCSDPTYVGCDPTTTVSGVVMDSRFAGPDVAFLAVSGLNHDGHGFITDAVDRGASVVILQRGAAPTPTVPHVWLADTRLALPSIASHLHDDPADHLRLLGVTGTNGKTTAAHLVATILQAAGRLHARLGTTGNWLVDHETPAAFTTPFPLELQGLLAQARQLGATDVVMEVSSHALVQARVAPLRFHAVGLTSFSQDHLDFHPSMHAYLQAKCELAGPYLARGGTAVAAIDGQPGALEFLTTAKHRGGRAWAASRDPRSQAELIATKIHHEAWGTAATVQTPAGELELHSPLIGSFNLDNLLVAIGLALAVDVSLDDIGRGLRVARGAPGRLEAVRVEGARGPTVLVDYAHTPDAVQRTLDVIRPLVGGKLVVVLGCGGDRDPSKRPQMGAIAARGADRFFATSDNPRTEDPDAIVTQMLAGVARDHRHKVVRQTDRGAAIAQAITQADEDDLVLIAGKGHEDYQILGTAKVHFDDREHGRRALLSRT